KSSGTKVDPKDIAAHVSADTLRYYLCREAAYGADLEWSDERLVARANADLANALGNLLSRTTSMVHKYLGGCVAADISGSPLVAMAAAAVDRVEAAVDACALQDVASIPMELVAAANAHIDAKAPWALAKDPARKDELAYMLAETAHLTYMAGALLVPIMPAKMGELVRRMTGVEPPKSGDWVTLRTRGLPKDRPLELGPPLFPRVDAIASEN
ncbi:MAG: methionine--tRNA ligase, partial [Planctomycetota bacterium]